MTLMVMPAVIAFSGCRDEPTGPTPSADSPTAGRDAVASAVHPDQLEPVQRVARTIAMALADSDVRTNLIQQMRGSAYNEHKLVLNPSAARAAESSLTQAARSACGGATCLEELLVSLGFEVDFYVPSETQRRTWTGSGRYLVAGLSDPDAEIALAFDASGQSRWITSLDNPGFDVVLVLHPAEPKSETERTRQPEGATIEDATDPRTEVLSSEAHFQVCPDPEVCGGVGGGGPPPPGSDPPPPPVTGTFVERIFVEFGDGIFAGEPEIYFISGSEFSGPQGFVSATRDVKKKQWVTLNLLITTEEPALHGPILALLFESDGDFLNDGDDPKGESVPLITGSGSYLSVDRFRQRNEAVYDVAITSS
ncbi:MAG: hypothetical protein RRA92_02580 [Gemmatimonadota bacterium]|nr:hypothetical protein [Gemmatimonadota bacterium]